MGKKKQKKPKSSCCDDRPKCNRCPLRMLKEGTLPGKYTVHKRKLVKVKDLERKRAARAA